MSLCWLGCDNPRIVPKEELKEEMWSERFFLPGTVHESRNHLIRVYLSDAHGNEEGDPELLEIEYLTKNLILGAAREDPSLGEEFNNILNSDMEAFYCTNTGDDEFSTWIERWPEAIPMTNKELLAWAKGKFNSSTDVSAEVICEYEDWSILRFTDGSLLHYDKEFGEASWVTEVYRIKPEDYDKPELSDTAVMEMCPKEIPYSYSGELDDLSAYCFWEKQSILDRYANERNEWYQRAVDHYMDTAFLGPMPVYAITYDSIILSSYEQGEIIQRRIEIEDGNSAEESLFYYFYCDVIEDEKLFKAFGEENIRNIAKCDPEIQIIVDRLDKEANL